MLPSSGVLDRPTPPQARCPVEIEEDAATRPSGMFQHEMPVQQNGFDLGEERVVAIDMRPPGLHHADFRVGEMVDGSQKKIFRRDEVSVKDGDELTPCRCHTL